MPIEGTINSLYLDYEQTKPLFPRTKTKAISDENGVGLDATLSKIQNDLSNKATEAFVTNKIAEAQLGGGSGSGDIDLSGFATKDDLNNIDFPVDSVNGKTGVVTLSAANVGAVSITLMWENASPISAFASQTIALDLSAYDQILIAYEGGKYFQLLGIGVAKANMSFMDTAYGNTSMKVTTREVTTSHSGVNFYSTFVKFAESNAYWQRDDFLVPYRIYGIQGVGA